MDQYSDYSTREQGILAFQVKRNVTVLFKRFLDILDRHRGEHNEALDKLFTSLPPEFKPYVDLADHFTDDKAQALRKEVLDAGNACIKAIQDEVKAYTISAS